MDLLQQVLKLPGWGRLVDLVKVQIANREKEQKRVVIHSMDDALHMNLGTGIILGLEMVLELPKTLIEEKSRDYREKLEIYNASSVTTSSAT